MKEHFDVFEHALSCGFAFVLGVASVRFTSEHAQETFRHCPRIWFASRAPRALQENRRWIALLSILSILAIFGMPFEKSSAAITPW